MRSRVLPIALCHRETINPAECAKLTQKDGGVIG